MNPLRSLCREVAIFYYEWALKEIDPQHDDVPAIVIRLRHLLNERHAKPCFLRRAIQWL